MQKTRYKIFQSKFTMTGPSELQLHESVNTLKPHVCMVVCSEVPGPAGHVKDSEDPPKVSAVSQGPHPPVSGRQG